MNTMNKKLNVWILLLSFFAPQVYGEGFSYENRVRDSVGFGVSGLVLAGLGATGLYFSLHPPLDCGYCCPYNASLKEDCEPRNSCDGWGHCEFCPANHSLSYWNSENSAWRSEQNSCPAPVWPVIVLTISALTIGTASVALGMSWCVAVNPWCMYGKQGTPDIEEGAL